MPYADHKYYTQSYHGRRIQEEETFLTYAERASEYMDMVTFDRLADGAPEEAAEEMLLRCCGCVGRLCRLRQQHARQLRQNCGNDRQVQRQLHHSCTGHFRLAVRSICRLAGLSPKHLHPLSGRHGIDVQGV